MRLAWVLFALFWGEAVLGGISVKVKLAWVSVMGHFLLALALVGVALVMHHRAGEPENTDRRAFVVSRPIARLASAVYALTIVVIVLGTLVTAAGPHGGDADGDAAGLAPRRRRPRARRHRRRLVVLTFALVVVLARTRSPGRVQLVASITVAVMAAQGVLGYVQYFNEIPALLVGFHVFGAVMVFACVQQLVLELRMPLPRPDAAGDELVLSAAVPERSPVARPG